MRTTLDIDEAILNAAKDIAEPGIAQPER